MLTPIELVKEFLVCFLENLKFLRSMNVDLREIQLFLSFLGNQQGFSLNKTI